VTGMNMTAARRRTRRWMAIKAYKWLYALLVIPVVYLVVFCYYPVITQFVLSFKEYRLKDGIWGSKWVGWENYEELFASRDFVKIVRNTLRISILSLLTGYFPPILLAIFLFDMRSNRFRRVSQSILYIPHFFSWIIVYNIMQNLFMKSGYVNHVIEMLGGTAKDFFMVKKYFMPMLLGSAVWKEIGWGTILYLAALSSIDTELFDVAKIDGANPWQRIWYITLPGIIPVIVFTLTLNLGSIFSVGTEQILLFYNPINYEISDVIGTWVYRQGLGKLKYSLGASVSQFQSIIGLILVLISNKLANKIAGTGIW